LVRRKGESVSLVVLCTVAVLGVRGPASLAETQGPRGADEADLLKQIELAERAEKRDARRLLAWGVDCLVTDALERIGPDFA